MSNELAKIALELYTAADGINETSIRELRLRILQSQEFTELAIHSTVVSLLSACQREKRRKITQTAFTPADEIPKPKRYPKELQDRLDKSIRSFLCWPLMDGTLLGEATKEQLLLDAEKYQQNADGNLRNAKFLRAVAERIEDGQTVQEVLTHEELKTLMAKAGGKPKKIKAKAS